MSTPYKKTLCFVLAACAALALFPLSAQASIPAYTFPDLEWFARRQAAEAKREEALTPDNMLTYEEASAYDYIKGGGVYADFPLLPDFKHYAKLHDLYITEYDQTVDSFYYLGSPDTEYTFRSMIIDYICQDYKAMGEYLKTLEELGFKQLAEIKSEHHELFTEGIRDELIYDPDFTLDHGGVIYMLEDSDMFMLLLIGGSVTDSPWGTLAECMEFRLYSLSNEADREVLEDVENE